MGGLTSAVHWWEEWQLRILVLTSVAVQVLLFILSLLRRFAVPGWVRFMTWLAYLGGDAVAIYALATLFNRHKDRGGRGSSDIVNTLEMMWAPVLLLHLGGNDGITAYNIEDNELWSRHLVAAVSQVTVAIYVFCKSWPPGGDKRLLQAAILLFIPGVVKCFTKPWALKSASIYSLVSSSRAATATQNTEDNMYPLQEYVKRVKEFVDHHQEHEGNGNTLGVGSKDDGFWAQFGWMMLYGFSIRWVVAERERFRERLQQLGTLVDDEGTRTWQSEVDISQRQGCFCTQFFKQARQLQNEQIQVMKRHRVLGEASDKLFVDLSSPYRVRFRILKYFWGMSQDRAYSYVQRGLVAAFHLLYTKLKTAGFATYSEIASGLNSYDKLKIGCRQLIMFSRVVLPWASIGLFHLHQSQSEAARKNDIIDVKITYAIFSCTAVLEFFSAFPIMFGQMASSADIYAYQERKVKWPEMVEQYSLVGYFASNKRHSKWMCIAGIFGCKDFVDQRILCMEPCPSSARISRLVLGYLNDGWKKEIQDAPSYRRFNDHSTHWPLFHVGLRSSIRRKRPFDESVLLWHIATDFCFFSSSSSGLFMASCGEELPTDCKAVQCTQMSNYMAYLLFVNPEMLLPGSRRNLFITTHQELQDIFKGDEQPPLEKKELTLKIISKLKSSSEATVTSGTFIHEAWMLAKKLQSSGDETKMWEEIQDVWVEMLCFSASRCRGYLHAKALGKGGEFLSYVWLLLFYMGMETFTDKLQREDLPSHEAARTGNNATTAPPSTSERVSSTTATASSASEAHTDAAAGASAAPSTSEICMAEDDVV